MSTPQNSIVLLNRLLALKESAPFLLVLDTLAQSAYSLVQEFVHKSQTKEVVFLSFETVNRPIYATQFVQCDSLSSQAIIERVHALLPPSAPSAASTKSLVIIDSLNYIASEELSGFISGLMTPTIVLVGVFHSNVPRLESPITNYPQPAEFLTYIASAIFEVQPLVTDSSIDGETLEYAVENLRLPIKAGLNGAVFKLVLVSRRKSGRSLTYKFVVNTATHEVEILQEQDEVAANDDEALLKDLTTFNLTTNKKQQLAKDQVELPFLEAQNFGPGGAIVYEFEKDDDYDEEDPYEDPF
ncbi:hypothetical protein BABINDRAFT_7457 [Babjeviella inositovora NRRL Y-12698]|uniref:Elongator complex protein 5 n=1 Tax=Babjeviella inositovora NRRL Y-12698 TaxID=984486 RepID=A0A1E3QUR5_9ASCO|nr:uncharacterized protein BABINDRAFT_7457 [Babjeviella inositovora NRRL Y-12698]ODQ80762.1 hypothetical protein BABINDRAFT_7457 [Babjeviella inositovora NRRL Y-12698]